MSLLIKLIQQEKPEAQSPASVFLNWSLANKTVKRTLRYAFWNSYLHTGLLAALMAVSSIPNIMSAPEAAAEFTRLGYPTYHLPFIGAVKLLGVIAILMPGFSRIKEWAYAGFVFDLAETVYSRISVGDPASEWIPLFLGLFILIAGSNIFYHKKLKAASLSIAK